MRNYKFILILFVTVLLAWACARDQGAFSEEPGGASPAGAPAPTASPSPGFRMRLSQGEEAGGRVSRPPAAATSPLSDGEVRSLLARLPKFQAGAGEAAGFAMRESSMPAPRTGATVKQPFPPPQPSPGGPEPVAQGPLEVLRKAPEGDVPLAPQVSVTFSQPMVAVTSQAEASKTVPVKLTPQPKGQCDEADECGQLSGGGDGGGG